MQISQTRVVVVVIMYRVVGSERQKERQKEESDKGSVEKEMERESGKQHRDTGYKHQGCHSQLFQPHVTRTNRHTPRNESRSNNSHSVIKGRRSLFDYGG